MTAPADANRDLSAPPPLTGAAIFRRPRSIVPPSCAPIRSTSMRCTRWGDLAAWQAGRGADPLDRAMDIRRGHPDVLRNAAALVELGRLAEGLNDYDLALAIRPDHAPTLNDRGCALLLLENFEEALATFARAVTIDPSSADFTNNLGRALVRLDRYDDALACFEDALDASGLYRF